MKKLFSLKYYLLGFLIILSLVLFNRAVAPQTSQEQIKFNQWLKVKATLLTPASLEETPAIEISFSQGDESVTLSSQKIGKEKTLHLLELVREANLISLGGDKPRSASLKISSSDYSITTNLEKSDLQSSPARNFAFLVHFYGNEL